MPSYLPASPSPELPALPSKRPALVEFRPFVVSGYRTGVLDIQLAARRVLSLPTQLGCRVGCTFCVSSTLPLVRSLTAAEMLAMVSLCLAARPADTRPLELSFTGEGEAALNWKAAAEVCRQVATLTPQVTSVRYCFSGLGASALLGRLDAGPYPCRLQFSLHTARQALRDQLVPRSEPLADIKKALLAQAHRFSSIELNVVLQDGVNDSDADLQALLAWADPAWPVLLNPLLTDGVAQPGQRTAAFEAALRQAGRPLLRYERVGRALATERIYPLLSALRLPRT